MYPYRKLEVWILGRQYLKEVYELVKQFPAEERFEMSSQLRRAALSVLCNITEGSRRASDEAFAHFVNIAAASASEASVILEVAADLGFGDPNKLMALSKQYDELAGKLYTFWKRLKKQ